MEKDGTKKDGLFARTDFSTLQKCAQTRDIHVDWYRKSRDILVAYGHIVDYAHDIEVLAEVDMKEDKLVDLEFKLNTFTEAKCLMICDVAQKMIGMPVAYGVEDRIRQYLGGACGCINLCNLMIDTMDALFFIYHINRVLDGEITFPEYGQILTRERKDSCLTFNFDIEDAGYAGDFKGNRDVQRF
ncbi:MAG: DUF2889 domain-containing protein [Lachnospiraceae bacterium]|nr:DUF2889 domain-containing protein [Lachnospiraceae bacterium]